MVMMIMIIGCTMVTTMIEACMTNTFYIEVVLVDVVLFIGHSQHLALIDVVHLDGLQDLSLHKVTYSHLKGR